MTTKKMDAADRRAQILSAALALAEKQGYRNLTLQQIADAAGVSKGLPMVYFGTMTAIRRAIVREAVRTCNLKVVAQALVAADPHVKKADPDLKSKALAAVA